MTTESTDLTDQWLIKADKSADTLLRLYRSVPRTGLYDSQMKDEEQVLLFLRYLKFLKQQLRDGPRNTELRRLTECAEQIRQHFKNETEHLFDLLDYKIDQNKGIDFVELMETYQRAIEVKNAGVTYKKYIKAQNQSTNESLSSEKLKEIKTALEQKYPNDVDSKIEHILWTHRERQNQALNTIQICEDILLSDPMYQRWIRIQKLWKELGFKDLVASYHTLDTETGTVRSSHGNNLEFLCTERILQVVSQRTAIPVQELTIVRNVLIKYKKVISCEIDIIIVHEGVIVACVEVKCGIYDVSNAIQQLAIIKQKLVHTDSKMRLIAKNSNDQDLLDRLKKDFNNFMNNAHYLVVTTIPQHMPVTGTSFSDLQLISESLFNKTDRWLSNIVDTFDDVILSEDLIVRISTLIESIRQRMNNHIDPSLAIRMLGDDLIIF